MGVGLLSEQRNQHYATIHAASGDQKVGPAFGGVSHVNVCARQEEFSRVPRANRPDEQFHDPR
jgi:hypothetical protein